MQLVVPALHAVGTLIGDVLPLRRPAKAVTLGLHQGEELILVCCHLHDVVDLNRQRQLPALSLFRCPILPGGHFFHAGFHRGGLYDAETLLPAEPVRGVAEPLDVLHVGVILPSGLEADGVHNEVRVQMFLVHVSRNLDLVAGELLRCEAQG